MVAEVQSVVFQRENGWTLAKSTEWIKKHGFGVNFRGKRPDVKATQIRYRQTLPNYPTYRSEKLGDGVMLVYGIR